MTSTPTPAPSASDADFQTETDKRLTELEIKQSYSDDLLEQLNLLVFKQQSHIDQLSAQLQRLQQSQARGSQDASLDPRAELPPHY
ncbi:SlyX family protein [Lampropedia aestuarii]|uniref:SlyX family protein n=1 Tax=Lampropedia aestuarii TaxID=2562762 RepID=A0A4S5BU71_9BURK|nr:SlyX family protein [Lampropedia aestuarii]THJ36457.1 SlyX family protein [Lampropedia aestuarii]